MSDEVHGEIVASVHRELACIAAKSRDPNNYKGKPIDQLAQLRLTDGSTHRMSADEYLAQLRAHTARLKGINERFER